MKTVTVIIGNSDDKLPQKTWCAFCDSVALRVSELAHSVHFMGGTPTNSPWQNAAWVFEVKEWQLKQLKEELAGVAHAFDQDSIAWLESDGELIFPKS